MTLKTSFLEKISTCFINSAHNALLQILYVHIYTLNDPPVELTTFNARIYIDISDKYLIGFQVFSFNTPVSK